MKILLASLLFIVSAAGMLNATPVYTPVAVQYAETSGSAEFSGTAEGLTASGINQVSLALSATGASPLNIATSQITDFQTALAGGTVAFSATSGTASWATSAGSATTSDTASALIPSASAAFATSAQGAKADTALAPDRLSNVSNKTRLPGVNQICTLRVGLLGDSVISNKRVDLAGKLYGYRGLYQFGGLGLGAIGATPSGGASLVTAANSGNASFSYWITGNYWSIPAGGSVRFDNNGTTPILGTDFRVYYITEPGGGTFKLQTDIDGSGTWTDVPGYTSVSTDGTLGGGVISFTKPRAFYRMQMVTTTGTCKGISSAIYNVPSAYQDQLYQVILSDISQGGIATSDMVSTPSAITAPILADAALDLVFFECKDSQAVLTANLPTLVNTFRSANPATDFVLIKSNPIEDATADADQRAQNAFLQTYGDANNLTVFDGYTPFVSGSAMVANGYMAHSDVHPNAAAISFINEIMMTSLPTLSDNTLTRNSAWVSVSSDNSGIRNPGGDVRWTLVGGKNSIKGLYCMSYAASGGLQTSLALYSLPNSHGTFPGGINLATLNGDMLRMTNNGSTIMGYNTADTTYPVARLDLRAANETGINVRSDGTHDIATVQNSIGSTVAKIDKDGGFISGGSSLNASAKMQADSTTQGFLPPRMTSTQRSAISSPAAGLEVFDTTSNSQQIYNGASWVGTATYGRTAITGGTYTALVTDDIIAVTGTAGATITLPSNYPIGKKLVIKDEGGYASPNVIQVNPASGTLNGDGGAGIVTPYGSRQVYTNGTNWFTY